MAEAESLQAQQQGELEELRFKQQEQVCHKAIRACRRCSLACRTFNYLTVGFRLRRWEKTTRPLWWRWRWLTVTHWPLCRRSTPGLWRVCVCNPGVLLNLPQRVPEISTNVSYPVPDLKMAHEQQTKSLEEEFEKIRLALQVEIRPLSTKKFSLFFYRNIASCTEWLSGL